MEIRVIIFLVCIFIFEGIVFCASDEFGGVEDSYQDNSYLEIYDPLEKFNRNMLLVNDAVDKSIAYILPLKPLKVISLSLQDFFENTQEPYYIVNNLIQLKIEDSFIGITRFLINSSTGLLGFFDIATVMGLRSKKNDLGLTLGYYGVGTGVYLYLPLLGPTNVRDITGFTITTAIDVFINPLGGFYKIITPTSGILTTGRLMSTYFVLRDDIKQAEALALDPYVFFKSTYMQYRAGKLFDLKSK